MGGRRVKQEVRHQAYYGVQSVCMGLSQIFLATGQNEDSGHLGSESKSI